MNALFRYSHAALIILMGAWLSGLAPGADDWRLELLKQRGFSGKTDELEALLGKHAAAATGLNTSLLDLASDDFNTRERAQASILMAGDATASWIEGLPVQEDPEVRFRLAEISEQLRNRGPGSQAELLEFAAKSLLAERKTGEKAIGPALVFAEWFAREADPLGNPYGAFHLQSDAGMRARVKGGCLKFSGDHDGEGDQALILQASALGSKTLPKKFRISCLMGGDSGKGAGAWHAGVSVGQVRILYHPGMKGGAFRFETTDRKRALCENKSMGFDPDTTTMQRIEIAVSANNTGDVVLDVRVASLDGKQVFRKKETVDAEAIGAIDRVGLWRSGRKGANALFDDFVLDLR